MERRRFLESALASTVVMLTGRTEVEGAPMVEPPASGWRTFEVTTRLEIMEPTGVTRAWVPLPLKADTTFQKRLGDTWGGNAADPRVARRKVRRGSPLRRVAIHREGPHAPGGEPLLHP